MMSSLRPPAGPDLRKKRGSSHGGGHSNELTLLLLCARTRTDGLAQERIETLLRRDVDWDVLIAMAFEHRVLPLLYHTIRRTGAAIPDPAMQRLRSAVQANVKRTLFLAGELTRVMDDFRDRAIPSIPYKGPVLASSVYGDVSLRQFGDLDIIVPVTEITRARTLLISRGYRPEKDIRDEDLPALIESDKDLVFFRDDRQITLEMHWGVTSDRDPIRIRPDSLWRDLETCSFGGRIVQVLAREDLLLILSIHGAKHCWARLSWLCDIAELARPDQGLSWARVLQTANRLRGTRIVLLAVALAAELLGTELPTEVQCAIGADSGLKPLLEQVKGWLLRDEPAQLDLGEKERYFMALRERSADKFRVAARQAKRRLALTSRDREMLPVPGFLTWSLYMFRPVRLAGQYGIAPFRRFLKTMFEA